MTRHYKKVQLSYGSGDLVREAVLPGGGRISYTYDHLDRLGTPQYNCCTDPLCQDLTIDLSWRMDPLFFCIAISLKVQFITSRVQSIDGRCLVGRRDSGGATVQFFYSLPHRPWLVTQVLEARESRLTSLVYDDTDRLIFLQINQDSYYVICDPAGSPFLYFSPGGGLAKEVSRSPYGHVTYDSNPAIRSHIGMFGGIQVGSNHKQYKLWHKIVLETEHKW